MVIISVSICCGDQTPSWLPSSPKGEIVGNMMQYVFLRGNLLDEVVLDGNLLDDLHFDSKLFVKDVKMMFLQVNSDVLEKGILVSVRKMKHEIFINVYTDLMNATRVHTLLSIQATRVYIQN